MVGSLVFIHSRINYEMKSRFAVCKEGFGGNVFGGYNSLGMHQDRYKPLPPFLVSDRDLEMLSTLRAKVWNAQICQIQWLWLKSEPPFNDLVRNLELRSMTLSEILFNDFGWFRSMTLSEILFNDFGWFRSMTLSEILFTVQWLWLIPFNDFVRNPVQWLWLKGIHFSVTIHKNVIILHRRWPKF